MAQSMLSCPSTWRGIRTGTLLGVPLGQLYIFTIGHGDSWHDAVMGICVSFLIAVGLTVHFQWFSPKIRRLPFIAAVIASGLSFGLVIVLSIGLSVWLMLAVEKGVSPFESNFVREMARGLATRGLLQAVLFTLGGMLILMFFIELSRKLGPGVLRNWLLGRYRKPRVEARVFMFLDMKDSTRLAEQIGDVQFSALLRDVFDDVTEPVLRTRGSVSHYIGDEVVLTWSLATGLKNANCIACFFQMKEKIASRELRYLQRYGLRPDFKAGMHCGDAVVTEVGQIKSEIVFHGDVLNTTARLAGLCSEVGEDLLISSDLASRLELPAEAQLAPMGERRLKGKQQEVGVFAVRLRETTVPAVETAAIA